MKTPQYGSAHAGMSESHSPCGDRTAVDGRQTQLVNASMTIISFTAGSTQRDRQPAQQSSKPVVTPAAKQFGG